jgi:hypothetical protein
MHEKVWYQDFAHFFTLTNYTHILPMNHMTLAEKLNAVCRLFIYLGILVALIRWDYRFLFLGICALGITYVIYEFESGKVKQVRERMERDNVVVVDNKVCARPTTSNPFMNPSVYDLGRADKIYEACDLSNPAVEQSVNRLFHEKMYRNASDVFNRESSQREFYTVPSTTIPNKQGEFAEWLYGKGATCKEGNGVQCYSQTKI